MLAAIAHAWPTANIFPASDSLPVNWKDVKAQTDLGVLRVASSMTLAATSGDSFIPFSIQPSRISGIPNIYAVAYSLEDGAIIAPVGRVKTEQYKTLGIDKGGMVSLRIPETTVKELASSSGVSAVRLAILAPEASSDVTVGQWAADSVVFALGTNGIEEQSKADEQSSANASANTSANASANTSANVSANTSANASANASPSASSH
ncbi:hypothetical protein EC988_001193 [Linderina pennispora]|nr:hypothetical protein EC988_001193 [Linderina pennispora]